jgi:hypothetical protein
VTAPPFKVFRLHRCSRLHKTHLSLSRCMFPTAAWVQGEGPYALLAWCSVLTVTLHPAAADALAAKAQIDDTGCAGRCYGRHEIVMIDLGSTAWSSG